MLALDADRGDLAIRSDLSKTFVLAAEPATSLANWLELLTPTDAVLSVAGRTGAITLTRADITDLGNITNDAQLKRSPGDFASFPHKPDPIGADVVLLENAAGGEKRSTTIAAALRGAASASVWLPDAAPLAPHALDYEGGTDISGFAEWDHGSIATLSTVDGHLRIAHAGGTVLPEEPGVTVIFAVYVTPTWRGKGLIAALTEAVAAWSRGAGRPDLMLEVVVGNDRAVRAYERVGFVDTGVRLPHPTTAAMTELQMRRRA